MNSRQENRSRLSFTGRIITKYSLERFLSICGENVSKGFFKSSVSLYQTWYLGKLKIIVSNLANLHKLNSRINYARLHCIGYKKQTSNTIITQTYHSRCSSWKLSSKPRIASDFSTLLGIKQGEKRKRCHFSTKKPIKKLAMNNRRLLIAAEFHFVHPVEKDS